MLERLHNIDWSSLTHAYGSAADVPGLLRALAADDRQARRDAYWELYGNIFHQGTRYPATAPAVPFLLELLADPHTPDRHELLLLLTHLVTGQFSVAADPVMYAGESDDELGADDDEPAILRAIYRAAEAGLPLYLDLVQHADTASLRAAASFLLACLWTRAAAIVPILRAHLPHEPSAPARASLAFALGRLQGEGGDEPALCALHDHDPAPLVRLIAAVGLVRNATRDVPDAAVATLIAAVHDPDSVPGYDDLPCGERDLPGDIGYVLRSLPRALGQRAVPALCAALARAEDFGTMGLVEALLAFTFGEPPAAASEDDPEDMSEQSAPPALDPARLTPEQRQALTAMATTHELWTVGNLFFVLRSYGIPTQRAELAALLGLPLVRDEAAELAAAARFHRVHMHNPAEAVGLLRRAAELSPRDASLWQQLAQALHATDDNSEAMVAITRALDLDPDHGPAHFTHGLVAVHTDPLAAASGFRRAAELGHQPLQATTNRATCLAMIGRRDEALQLLERLTSDHPEFAEGWYSLGLARVKLGHHAAAILALGRAIALDPDHANAHYARACAHALQAEANPAGSAQALADIARAVAIEPGLRPAIRDDADFEALADHPEFQRLTAAEPVPGPGSVIHN